MKRKIRRKKSTYHVRKNGRMEEWKINQNKHVTPMVASYKVIYATTCFHINLRTEILTN